MWSAVVVVALAGAASAQSGCGNAMVQDMIAMNNDLRKSNAPGAPMLQCEEAACQAATDWSKQQCAQGQISHNNFSKNCEDAGLMPCAENVLFNMDDDMGASTKQGFDQWKTSPGHYKNMVKPDFEVVGYGYYECEDGKKYWTGLYGNSGGGGGGGGSSGGGEDSAPAPPSGDGDAAGDDDVRTDAGDNQPLDDAGGSVPADSDVGGMDQSAPVGSTPRKYSPRRRHGGQRRCFRRRGRIFCFQTRRSNGGSRYRRRMNGPRYSN